MTLRDMSDKLKAAATLWQLIGGIITGVVIVTVYAFEMKRDIRQNRIDFEKEDRIINAKVMEVQVTMKEDHKESVRKQDAIIEKLNELKVLLERKQDRK